MSLDFIRKVKAASTLKIDDVSNSLKLYNIMRFQEIKMQQPELKKSEICTKLGISESTLSRNMRDLNIKSFYRHTVPINNTSKKKSKDDDVLKIQKSTKKNNSTIKGGNGLKADTQNDNTAEYNYDKFANNVKNNLLNDLATK